MEFTQSSDHEAIREGIRKICASFDDDYWSQQDEAHEFPWEFYNRLAEGGWVGIAIPEEYGGGGQGITEASVMLEEIASAAMNGCSTIHLSIFGMEPVRRYGSPELAAEVLLRVATGELHVAFGVTEPDAGTDTTAIRTPAVRDGDEYVVTGAKVWTTRRAVLRAVPPARAHHTARECARPTDGMTLLLVDLQRPRSTSVRSRSSALRGVSCEVRYDGLRVPVSRRRRRGPRVPLPARRAQPGADPHRVRSARHRQGRAPASGELRP